MLLDQQLVLLRSCWAPLLMLELAQDRLNFETVETPLSPACCRASSPPGGGDRGQRAAAPTPTAAALGLAAGGRVFALGRRGPNYQGLPFAKCRSLDITTKGTPTSKGTVLFNPGKGAGLGSGFFSAVPTLKQTLKSFQLGGV